MLRTIGYAFGILAFGISPCAIHAEQTNAMSDSDYVGKLKTAAPAQVVANSTIVILTKSGKRVLQTGTDGFTCVVVGGELPLCADRNALDWMRAIATHGSPPDGIGFAYMLAGDMGDSNTEPYAAGKTESNHWVQTGPHVMIFGPGVKAMGYPAGADADPTKPFVMWPDTPYAHLMIPVAPPPAA
jgi:hypothetical protein